MKKLNLPNRLTVIRLMLVPVLILVLYFIPEKNDMWAIRNVVGALVFLGIAITDALDGKIARKHGLITNFGKFLDPLADKFLVVGAMTMILYLNSFSNIRKYFVFVYIIILLREFAVTGLRLIISGEGVVLAAAILGKVKTVLQIVFVMTAFLEPVLYRVIELLLKGKGAHVMSVLFTYPPLTFLTMAGALLFTVWSGIDYFKACSKYIDPEK